eukprot:scpid94490/ scgid15443/ 
MAGFRDEHVTAMAEQRGSGRLVDDPDTRPSVSCSASYGFTWFSLHFFQGRMELRVIETNENVDHPRVGRLGELDVLQMGVSGGFNVPIDRPQAAGHIRRGY